MKDLPESEFCLELTPEELEELKGGYANLIRKYPSGSLPNGIVITDLIIPVPNKPTGGGFPNGIVNPNLLS